MIFLLKCNFLLLTAGAVLLLTEIPVQGSSQRKYHTEAREGAEESSGGAFSQEHLEQMGQEIGNKVGEQMMQVGKEEFQTGLHKVEDKIDRNTDKWIDDMSNRIQSGI